MSNNIVRTAQDWAQVLSNRAKSAPVSCLSHIDMVEIAAYLTAYANPVPFEHMGIKVGPEHDASVVLEMPTGEVIQVWAHGNNTDRPVVYQWANAEEFETGHECKLQIDVPRSVNIVKRVTFDHIVYQIEQFSECFYVHVVDDGSEVGTERNPESGECLSLADAVKWVADDISGQLTKGE